MMLFLIRKEWIAMRYYLLFVLGYGLFFTLFISSTTMGLMTMICLPAVMMAIYGASIDLRNKSLTFTGSLPLSRKMIVTGKYVIGGLYLVIGLLAAIGLYYLFPLFDISRALTVDSVMGGLMTGVAFLSIYYPVQFWLGASYSNIVSVIVVMVLVVSMGTLNSLLERSLIPEKTMDLLIGVIPLLAFILLAASYLLSLAIFRKKDMEG